VTPEEVKQYYQENIERFTIPASATVKTVSFTDKETADKFREKLIAGDPLEELAKGLGGKIDDLGTVGPGQLPPVIDQLVFKSEAPFAKAGDWEVSEVVEVPTEDGGKIYQVILLKDRKDAVTKEFEEVKAEVEQLALADKRARTAAEWIEQLKQETPIENKIVEVLESLAPKQEEPATQQAQPSEQENQPAEETQEAPAGN